MAELDLSTDDGLRAACDVIGRAETWSPDRLRWVHDVETTIEWVRAADVAERSKREFQSRLWEANHIAAVGQGNVSIEQALDDRSFREWLATRSLEPLPTPTVDRVTFLTALYESIMERLRPILSRHKVPRLKIIRLICALYPEAMTTVASRSALKALTNAMGAAPLDTMERHVWVRDRLDKALGTAGSEARPLAERITLPWLLFEKFARDPESKASESAAVTAAPNEPLPAALRRRGLTPIKGYFQNLLATLEFLRGGKTRQELLDFLQTASPESKASTLGLTINVYESELGAIRREGSHYVLTAEGRRALDSQEATPLANWLLYRVLGVDQALVALRERAPLAPSDLVAEIRALNPGWTTDVVPQAIVSWLRSMGVVELRDGLNVLTTRGEEWAARVTWKPESLPPEPKPGPDAHRHVKLPSTSSIVASVAQAGHFEDHLVAQLHAGLWANRTRHFAVLTGLSGSGKTLLARAYAKALDTSADRLLTLPVQPGWYDPGPLLGYENPLRDDSYVRTEFLDFLITASGDPERPYVLVLDEMNLSHPEQYMAPLLSAMETGESIRLHSDPRPLDGIPSSVPFPRNLAIIGTVNMDETTHGLSDKVLDRAFVLEFWRVNLDDYPRWERSSINSADLQRVRDLLIGMMGALSPARLHFGWRVVDDVLDFLSYATAADVTLSFNSALDAVVYAKILPKLRGEDSVKFRDALKSCAKVLDGFNLVDSRSKVMELAQDLESTGAARFWR